MADIVHRRHEVDVCNPLDATSGEPVPLVVGTMPSTPVETAGTQDLTASWASYGSVDMSRASILGIKVEAVPNASENGYLRVRGMLTSSDTPFEINTSTTNQVTLWTGTGASNFTEYWEFDTGALPYVDIQAKVGTANNVAAYLTGGTNGASVFGTFAAITNASFAGTFDSVLRQIQNLDLSSGTSMDMVADLIQAAIRTATSGTETVAWSTDHFVITSGISTTLSQVSKLITYPRTDISGIGATQYLDADAGTGVATARAAAYLTGGTSIAGTISDWTAVSDGALTATIDGTGYNIDSLDFSGAADDDAVAAIVQAGIRAATSSTETFVFDTDHFVCTSVGAGADSAVLQFTTNGTVGTDITGTGFLDCAANAVETAVAAAYLTGGSGASGTISAWTPVTDGAFRGTFGGTVYDIDAIDFSGATTMAGVATVLQSAINTATSGTYTVAWSTDHFVITSGDLTTASQVSVLETLSETDISGATYMDCAGTNATETAVVLAGDLTITVVKA